MALWPYAVGRIRALETRLLGAERLQQLSELPGIENIINALLPNGYHRPEKNDTLFQKWLGQEESALVKLCDHLLAETDYPFFYRLPVDIINLSLLARQEAGVFPGEISFVSGGFIPEKELDAIWQEKLLFSLPSELAQGIIKAKKAFATDKEVGLFDYHLNQMAINLYRQAAGSSVILQNLALFFVDRANIRNFFTEGRYFLNGGKIPAEAFGNRQTASNQIVFHYPVLKSFLEDKERKNGAEIETAFRTIQKEILAESRFISLGPEPVLAYYYHKKWELADLRHILLRKSFQG